MFSLYIYKKKTKQNIIHPALGSYSCSNKTWYISSELANSFENFVPQPQNTSSNENCETFEIKLKLGYYIN